MLLQEYQRFALECKLSIQRHPEKAPKFLLSRILPKLQKHVDQDLARHETNHGRKTLILKCMKVEQRFVKLLFQFADKDATDPSFTNTQTGQTRTESKQADEGISVSAHMLISLNPQSDLLDVVHDVIIEEVPGISKTVIRQGLNYMLRECATEEFIDPETDKKLQCRPLVELDFCGGEKLEELLKTGRITGFSAVKNLVKNQLDEDGELIVSQERVEIKVKKARGKKAISLIEKAKNLCLPLDYSKIMIRYEGDNKRHRTLEVMAREQNIAEKFFAKSSIIDVEEKLNQCEETFHHELVSKMEPMLMKMAEKPKRNVR